MYDAIKKYQNYLKIDYSGNNFSLLFSENVNNAFFSIKEISNALEISSVINDSCNDSC